MYTEPLYYILATQICLALFWIFYRIVLARRKTLALNRYFLLTSVALSFLIPALSIPVAEPYGIMFEAAGQTIETVTPQEEVSSPASFDWGKALLLIQLIGSTAVLSFLVAGILRLRRLTYHATLIQNGKIRIYSLQAPDLAFSLFNRIYLSTADRDETTLRQIVAHETAHIHFHHSRDIALICVLQTLFWWNPFVWLWRRSLREVHEFQADDFVLNNGSDAQQYITLMLNLNGLKVKYPEFANGFCNSLTKKRLTMITQNRSKWARYRVLWSLPLIGALMLCFSFTERPEATDPTEVTEQKGTDTLSNSQSSQHQDFDVPPQFPGGQEALIQWMIDAFKYPKEAQTKKISGTVLCRFVVKADGSIDDITIVKSPDAILSKVVLETMQKMPKWKPAMKDNKPVDCTFTFPCRFSPESSLRRNHVIKNQKTIIGFDQKK